MALKNKTIIAVCVKLLFWCSSVQAQTASDSSGAKPAPVYISPATFTGIKQQLSTPAQLPGNHYAKQLPFFCNTELKLQKKLGFPVKFRVGSVAYCDRLEGKNR